jgi:hypothetical protein
MTMPTQAASAVLSGFADWPVFQPSGNSLRPANISPNRKIWLARLVLCLVARKYGT